MTCGNGHTMRYLAYQAGIIGNRANSFQSGMSGLPSPPLAEPCDEEIEPTPYRDGEAEWTASGDVVGRDDAATEGRYARACAISW